MKKVAILQSNYIPWKGYFHIIQKVDYFVFLDTAQYTKRDWRNRNLIKTPEGLKWLSVPNNGTQKMMINEVQIDNDSKWFEIHFKTLENCYKKTKYFKDYSCFLEKVYLKTRWQKLSELNQFMIKEISKFLGIQTIFCNSDEFNLVEGKNKKIISIMQQLQSNYYLTGPSAKSYLDVQKFKENNIKVEFMNYPKYPEYPQSWVNFENNVSILDLLFCVGQDAPNYIWEI